MGSNLYIVLIFIGAIALLVCDFVIASKFDSIAKLKGHSENYFAYCFFFGIVGWLMVVALPDKNISKPNKTEFEDLPKS